MAVRLFAAQTESRRISLTSVHRACNCRLVQRLLCPVHGEVPPDEICRACPVDRERYVLLEPGELPAVPVSKAIEVEYFADCLGLLEPLYTDAPYYVAPDGPMAEAPFRVVHEAMRLERRTAIGRVVLAGRRRAVALVVHGRGLLMTTLRPASEVRGPEAYFQEIGDGSLKREHVRAARELIEGMTRAFDPQGFEDPEQAELRALVERKVAAGDVIMVRERESRQAEDFGEALQASNKGARRRRGRA